MEEFRSTTVWELLKIMQKKVKGNAYVIQKNVQSLESIKKQYPSSRRRDKVMNAIYKKNYELTRENQTLLELHNSLIKFYKVFKGLLIESDVHERDSYEVSFKEYRKSCMEKSISGELKINSSHPFIGDLDFLDELMDRCSSMELFERCSEIKKVKSEIGHAN